MLPTESGNDWECLPASCRDKGWTWRRVGALCLSWWPDEWSGFREANRLRPVGTRGGCGEGWGPCAQYISLKAKRGKDKTRKLQSGILPESNKKNSRSFRCTDYAKWKSMTRCVNR